MHKPTYSLSRYPLGLGYLAAEANKMPRWKTVVYNADFSHQPEPMKVSYLTGEGFQRYRRNLADPSAAIWQEIQTVMDEISPHLVGISAKSQNFAAAAQVARLVKSLDPTIPVIAGGPHPSMVAEEVAENPYIDIAVRGEGEQTLVELLEVIEQGGDLNGVKGIVFKKNGEIIVNPPRPLNIDLDALGFPNSSAEGSLMDYDLYKKDAFRFIFPARGCPYNCFFCGSRNIWTRSVRYRSVDNVMREISELWQSGIRNIQFEDDTFGVNRRYTLQLCDALKNRFPGLEWACKLHAGLVDDELVSHLKDAGCTLVMLGVESGSNQMLKKIRKGITIQQAFDAAKIVKSHGIRLHTFFMVGFPEETEETLAETVDAMENIHSDFLVYSIFTPYPGTESFIFCKKNKLIGEDYDVSLYNHQSPANCFCLYIKPKRFRELVSQIEKRVDRKNTLTELERLIKLEDKDEYKLYRIASEYKRLGLFSQAGEWFRQVLKRPPGSGAKGGAYFHLAEMKLIENNNKEALALFRKCLTLEPGHLKAAHYIKNLSQKGE